MKIRHVLDNISLGVGIISPLIGVVWFEWNIDVVIFLYAVEAGVIATYHIIEYYLKIQGSAKEIKGMYLLRIGVEILLVLGAFTVFIDSIIGYRSTVFDDFPILLQYTWITIIPIASIMLHYINKVKILLDISPSDHTEQLSPIFIWLAQLPLPLFVCAYILATNNYGSLIGLLFIVILLKGVTEYIQVRSLHQAEALNIIHDPLILRSSIVSTRSLIAQLTAYILVVMGFFALNPFTQDMNFSPTENTLIFLGILCVVSPFLLMPNITLRLNTQSHTIEITQHWLRRSYRSIAIGDIIRAQAIRNDHKKIHAYIFTIKNEVSWKCSVLPFKPTEWKAWLEQLKTADVDL